MKKLNILLSSLTLGAFLLSGIAYSADPKDSSDKGRVLFKIHDIAPEKDVNGNITGCNMAVTLFNNYDKSISNTQLVLIWDDEVIADIINQEEYEQKEAINRNPNANRSRYPTSKTTAPTISATIKIPLINAHQQLSVKNKVNTDRCFLLINDMNVKTNSCSFGGDTSGDNSCKASFVYISPKNPQYFSEFKEISYNDEIVAGEKEISRTKTENDEVYNNIVSTLSKIGL